LLEFADEVQVRGDELDDARPRCFQLRYEVGGLATTAEFDELGRARREVALDVSVYIGVTAGRGRGARTLGTSAV
jgi:hypothetical protein